MASRVLIVEDDAPVRRMLSRSLEAEGFDVSSAADGGRALAAAERSTPDLVVLDVAMPGLDGLAVCRRLREKGMTGGILMLTARDAVDDRVSGLAAGADDYVVKPFDYDELLARIRAVARRRMPAQREILRSGAITLDHARRVVAVNGEVVSLTLREYDLLRLFMLNPQIVLSRQVILDRVWGYDFFGDDNNVEVYVAYLRRKLGEGRHHIETVRGVGYRMAV